MLPSRTEIAAPIRPKEGINSQQQIKTDKTLMIRQIRE
jgi:hypothetical protein